MLESRRTDKYELRRRFTCTWCALPLLMLVHSSAQAQNWVGGVRADSGQWNNPIVTEGQRVGTGFRVGANLASVGSKYFVGGGLNIGSFGFEGNVDGKRYEAEALVGYVYSPTTNYYAGAKVISATLEGSSAVSQVGVVRKTGQTLAQLGVGASRTFGLTEGLKLVTNGGANILLQSGRDQVTSNAKTVDTDLAGTGFGASAELSLVYRMSPQTNLGVGARVELTKVSAEDSGGSLTTVGLRVNRAF